MTLILLPNLLGETGEEFLPPAVAPAVTRLNGLIAESEKAGRRFLSRFSTKRPARDIPLALLNEHTKNRDEIDFLLEPVVAGETWGVVSDAGMPCLADPGADLVRRARRLNLAIEAIPGPSSIPLALTLSGLSGQSFSFIGYLKRERAPHLQELERAGTTQIFIEAPYRNTHTLQAVVETLSPETWLCVACDLTLPTQMVITRPIKQWREQPLPDIHKRPTVFLINPGRKAQTSLPKRPSRYRGRPSR